MLEGKVGTDDAKTSRGERPQTYERPEVVDYGDLFELTGEHPHGHFGAGFPVGGHHHPHHPDPHFS